MATYDHDLLWTLASGLVARQGPVAAQRAMERSREAKQRGDESGAALWARVAEIAEKMLRPN